MKRIKLNSRNNLEFKWYNFIKKGNSFDFRVILSYTVSRLEGQGHTIDHKLPIYDMETHKEIFTRYLSEAPRWTDRFGENKIMDWNEWLSQQEIIRCSLTGVYGEMGNEVHYVYDYDQPVRIDGIYPLKFLAYQKGFELERTKIDGEWVLEVTVEHENASNIFDVGEVVYRFCDTELADKEHRVEKWLESREDLQHRGSKWDQFEKEQTEINYYG